MSDTRTYGIRDAEEWLGLNRKSIWNYIKRYGIKVKKVKGEYAFTMANLNAINKVKRSYFHD